MQIDGEPGHHGKKYAKNNLGPKRRGAISIKLPEFRFEIRNVIFSGPVH